DQRRARSGAGNSARIPTPARSFQSLLEATVRWRAKTRARSDGRFRGRAQKEAGVRGARKSFVAPSHLLELVIREANHLRCKSFTVSGRATHCGAEVEISNLRFFWLDRVSPYQFFCYGLRCSESFALEVTSRCKTG